VNGAIDQIRERRENHDDPLASGAILTYSESRGRYVVERTGVYRSTDVRAPLGADLSVGRRMPARGLRGQEGQAAIEFALVLPVLLLLIVGILKFGVLYNHYITLTDSVRVGARSLSLGRGLPDPCTPALTQTKNNALSLNLTDSQITLYVENVANQQPSVCSTLVPMKDDPPTMAQGNQVTVKATYPCDLVIMGINLYPGCTLKASATEAIE
jgi:hypothetical protein